MTWLPFALRLRPRRTTTVQRTTGWAGIDRARLGLPRMAQAIAADPSAALLARVAELEQRTQRDAFLLLRLEAARAALQRKAETVTAELAAERAETARLADEVVRLRRVHAAALARLAAARLETCQCCGTDTHWRRRSEQDRANALRMADQLAAAERRPVSKEHTP